MTLRSRVGSGDYEGLSCIFERSRTISDFDVKQTNGEQRVGFLDTILSGAPICQRLFQLAAIAWRNASRVPATSRTHSGGECSGAAMRILCRSVAAPNSANVISYLPLGACGSDGVIRSRYAPGASPVIFDGLGVSDHLAIDHEQLLPIGPETQNCDIYRLLLYHYVGILAGTQMELIIVRLTRRELRLDRPARFKDLRLRRQICGNEYTH